MVNLDMDDLTPAMMCDEIKSCILEKRAVLEHAVAKRRMKEMTDITRMRIATLERIWIYLDKIARGKMEVAVKSADPEPKALPDKAAGAAVTDEISDDFPD